MVLFGHNNIHTVVYKRWNHKHICVRTKGSQKESFFGKNSFIWTICCVEKYENRIQKSAILHSTLLTYYISNLKKQTMAETTLNTEFKQQVLSTSSMTKHSKPASSTIPHQHRRSSRVLNPVISAMHNSNNLRDCLQVQELYYECQQSNSSSFICDTAAKYFVNCSMSDK